MALNFLNDGYFAGKVGIRTESPTGVLHIKTTDDSTFWLAKIEADGTTQNALLAITDTTSGTGVRFDLGGQTGSFTVLNSGNVGIGTTSPNYKLDVIGSGRFTTSSASLYINSSNSNGAYVVWENDGTDIGYIGSGYHLWSSPNNIANNLGIRANTRLDLGVQANVHMTILSSGNVGIGTTNPSAKLVVTDNINGQDTTLKVNHTRSNSDVATQAIEVDMNLSGSDTTTADRTNSGIRVDLDSSADGDANNEQRIYGVFSDVAFTGFSDLARGGFFKVESNNNTEKTSQMVGVYGQATHDSNNAAGGVSNMYGVYGIADIQDLGDVDNAFGGYFQVELGDARGAADFGVTKGVEGHININKAATVSYSSMTAVSAVIDNNEGTAPNFNNQFLFKGDYQGDRGSDAYGIYCEGDKHYLEGKLAINLSTPTQVLHVAGNARVTGAYYDSNNSPGTANQVLVSTVTGTDWVDGSGSSIIGGPYLPLAGGTMTGRITTTSTEAMRINANDAFISGYTSNGLTRNGYIQFQSNGVVIDAETGQRRIILGLNNLNKVGIGTTTPGGKLDIYYSGTGGTGTQGIGEGLNITSLTPNITFNDLSSSVDNYAIHLNQNVLTLGRYTSATSQSPDLVLTAGNVGIGTISPSSEANLSLAANSTSEGGHLVLFKGTSQTQATHLDNYANTFRIMNGTDASSGAVQFSLNHITAAATFAGQINNAKGISSDTHAKSFTWRIENTGSNSNYYYKIARVTSTQSARFKLQMIGGQSFSNNILSSEVNAYGQLNNDNNYDLIYHQLEKDAQSGSPIIRFGQVDVDTVSTDLYVQLGTFAELAITASISDGTLTPFDSSTGSSAAPTGFVNATEQLGVLSPAVFQGTVKLNSQLIDGSNDVGTPGQLLSSTGSLTNWVDASAVIGGPYLPLAGGTLTGPLTVGASTDGHDVFFYGDAAGEGMLWDESESRLTINHDTDDSGLDVFTVSSAQMTQPQLRVGRNTNEFWGVYIDDRNAHLVHRQDETTGTMTTRFDQWDSNTSDTLGHWAWRSGNGSGGSMSTALELKQSGDAIFTGDVKANTHFTSSDTNVTLSTNSNGTVFLRPNGKASTTAQSTFTTALASIGTSVAITGAATATTATTSTDNNATLTTKGYVDGLVTGVPVYKGTWDARNIAEGGATDGGNPDLRLAANKVLGNYYIVSTAGSASPNGGTTEPNSWNVGDWCIFSDVTPGTGTDLWQKIDNTSVISGAGTGQKVTKWDGTSGANSETLTDGPITFSTNDSTFAGDINIGANHVGRDADNYVGFETDNLIKFRVAGNTQVKIADGTFAPQTDSDIDLGSSSTRFKELWVDSINGGSVVPGSYLPLAGGTMASDASINMNSGQLTSVDFVDFGIGQLNGESTSIFVLKSLGDIYYNVDSNNNGNSSHIFQESGSELMRIRYDGNVGIGTSSPDNISSTGTVLSISTQGALTTNSLAGSLTFLTNDASFTNTYADGVTTEISSICESTTGAAYGLSFSTSTITSSNRAERLRITATGKVGIGTTSPVSPLTIKSNSVSSGESGLIIQANASTNSIIKLGERAGGKARLEMLDSGVVKTAFYTDGNNNYINAGNVGIGTTSPSAKLEIDDTFKLEGNLRLGDSSVYTGGWARGMITLYQNTSTGSKNFVRQGMLGNSDALSYWWHSMNTTTTTPWSNNAFRIYPNNNVIAGLQNGKVGIGTTSPLNPLEVNGVGSFTGGLVAGVTDSHTAGIYLNTESRGLSGNFQGYARNLIQSAGSGVIEIGSATSLISQIKLNAGSSSVNGIVVLMTKGAERMRVASDGKVGIGTTSPDAKLEVAGGSTGIILSNLGDSSAYDAVAMTYNGFNSGTPEFIFQPKTNPGSGIVNSFFRFKSRVSGGSNISNVTVDGKVGIGTTSPGVKLTVVENASGLVSSIVNSNSSGSGVQITAGNGTNNSLQIRNYAGGELMRVQGNGKVGIGTTNPTYKLSVSGGIEAGGLVTYSKVAGSLNTTGYAIAGLTTGFNGASAGFEFKCYGSNSKYQRVVYSCHCSGTTWVPGKVIDEGTNDLDVVASANGATITFTFKARSSTQAFSPRVVIQATGHSINSTYA